ncbi:MAG: AarF/ABC1/UbiB kinase family protein [Acidimicrobiales bacterium]|nr:AarF/ABC1/UbiB kinase family protein [Acidimicrobiales bacterium]
MTDLHAGDLDVAAFSDHGPWLVDLDELEWMDRVDTIRSAIHRQVPDLIAPGRMPAGRRMFDVVRHLGTAVGSWYLTGRRRGGSESTGDLSHRLRVAAETLGPTYIKLGQIISSGQGVFPKELVNEFIKCRDQVPSESFETVRRVVESDLGKPLEAVFSEFDETPLAAASIAQVHRAVLADNGQPGGGGEVVVKVQRPRVAEFVHQDLRVMAWIAPFMIGRIPVSSLANPPALVEVFAETIAEELDFRLEAENMLDVARSLRKLGQTAFVIPRPHPQLVTRRVLVMERLSGFNFDDVAGIKGAGIDTHEIVKTSMIGFLEGAMLHGVFHGDLHGGNLFVQTDGRTALFDFGITGRLSDVKRQAFLRMLVSGMTSDIRGQLAAIRDLGALPADTDLDRVIADLGLDQAPLDPTQLSPEQLIHELQRFVKQLLGYGASLPKELMLFVKNMVFVDAAIGTLAPDLDLFAHVTEIATYFATNHAQTLMAELGVNPDEMEVDLTSFKDSLGVDRELETVTYADLQARRELIQSRMRDHSKQKRRRFRFTG